MVFELIIIARPGRANDCHTFRATRNWGMCCSWIMCCSWTICYSWIMCCSCIIGVAAGAAQKRVVSLPSVTGLLMLFTTKLFSITAKRDHLNIPRSIFLCTYVPQDLYSPGPMFSGSDVPRDLFPHLKGVLCSQGPV